MSYGFKTAEQLRIETEEARERIAEQVRSAIENAKTNGDFLRDFAPHEIPLWLEEILKNKGMNIYYNAYNRKIVSWSQQ